MTDTIQVGAWIDGPHPGKDAASLDMWAARIVGAGITRPIVVTNAGHMPIHLSRWPVGHLRDAIAALRQAGAAEVGVMVWPIATARGVDELVEDVGELYGWRDPSTPRHLVPDFVCIDAEGNHNTRGWGPGGAALATALCDGLEQAQEGHADTYLSVTAIPPRRGLRTQDNALIAHPAVRVATPQPYSQWQGGKAWTHNAYFRPGPIQRGTWATWGPLVEHGHVDHLVYGMAIYAQDHPGGPTGVDALRFAAQTAIDLGVRRFCYWSWKHMRGASTTHQARRAFLRELASTPCPDLGDAPTQPPAVPLAKADTDADDLPTLRRGSRGRAVRELQVLLRAVGHYTDGAVDGIFGRDTEGAVKDFERDVAHLPVDGVVDHATWGALHQAALVTTDAAPRALPDEAIPSAAREDELVCDDATWEAWVRLKELAVNTPFRYVPGRGGFDAERGVWVVRRRPGSRLGVGSDLGAHGFVCSTWTNFLLGCLTRRGEDYTPEGGMPSLFDLCVKDSSLHTVPGSGGRLHYRGYGEHCRRLAPGKPHLTLRELFEMRMELPTFVVAGHASRRRGSWGYHHTVAFVVDHRQPGSPLYRIAADGSRRGGGFSKTPMRYQLCDDAYIARHDKRHRLRCYAVVDLDAVAHKPMAPVTLEDL